MPPDAWQVETHRPDDPDRAVVLRTTLLPIGDVMLAVDRGWWLAAPLIERQALLATHRRAIARHLVRHDRLARLTGLAGAAGGAGVAWAGGLPIAAVMPAAALAGWAAARLGIARRLRAGLLGAR